MFSYCLCVCVSVCVSVCLCVQAITFECLDTETSFLVWWYILTISTLSLSINALGKGQGLFSKMDTKFVCYDLLTVLMWSLRSRSRSFHGQGNLKVTVIIRSRSFVMCFDFYPESSNWLSSECLSYLFLLERSSLKLSDSFSWQAC